MVSKLKQPRRSYLLFSPFSISATHNKYLMNCESAQFCVAQFQFDRNVRRRFGFTRWLRKTKITRSIAQYVSYRSTHAGARTPLFIAGVWWTALPDVRSHSPSRRNEKRRWEFITFQPAIRLKTHKVTEWEREWDTHCPGTAVPTLWPSVTFTHNGFKYRREADYSWCNILLAGAETPECWTRVSKGSERPGRAPTRRLH